MNRYQNSATILDSVGKRRKSTIILPTPTPTATDTYIQTTTIERLDLLAYAFYGDVTLWWAIAAANGLGKGSLYVPINSLLRIPDITSIDQQTQTVNTNR
jgi:phage tail protein X